MYPGPALPPNPTKAQRATHDAAFEMWAAEERARIARQRAAFRELMGPSRAALQQIMLDRAWELLDAGECEACDALLEFVPEEAADALLNDYFEEPPTTKRGTP